MRLHKWGEVPALKEIDLMVVVLEDMMDLETDSAQAIGSGQVKIDLALIIVERVHMGVQIILRHLEIITVLVVVCVDMVLEQIKILQELGHLQVT